MCTRIICYETTHSKILSKLCTKWILLNEFVTEAPEDLKRVFELMSCPNLSSFLSLNCFIGCTRLNDRVVPREEENFPDINLLGANHQMLIFTHFLTIVSRISVNYLYKHLTQKWHKPHVGQVHRELHVGRPLDCVYVGLIVWIIKVLCRQYFKLFYYKGFINVFDNLLADEINDSFTVITKKNE